MSRICLECDKEIEDNKSRKCPFCNAFVKQEWDPTTGPKPHEDIQADSGTSTEEVHTPLDQTVTGRLAQKPELQELPPKEMVNHPDHYGGEDNPYETIKVIEAKGTPEEVIGFLKFTAIRYLDRGKHKELELQDYQKAQWYLNRLTTFMKKQKQ